VNKKIIFLGIIAVAGYFVYRKYMKFVERLTYSIVSIQFNVENTLRSGFRELFFTVNTKLINPENVKVKVNSIQIFFAVNNKTFAQIATFEPFFVEPKKEMPIKFPLQIFTDSVPQTLKNLLTNFKQGSVKIEIFGKVNTNLGEYKFNEIKSLI
jgi:LEA14-like dessication related protein